MVSVIVSSKAEETSLANIAHTLIMKKHTNFKVSITTIIFLVEACNAEELKGRLQYALRENRDIYEEISIKW